MCRGFFGGRDYYGTGVDTCVITKCHTGYHIDSGVCVANKINISWDLGYGDNNTSITTCSYNEVIVLPQEPVRPGDVFTGWKIISE